MPATISGTDAVVTILNRAFNDRSPSFNIYANQVTAANEWGAVAFAKSFGSAFTGLTEDQLSTKLLGNLGVLPDTGLQIAVRDYLVAVGKASVGIVGMQLGQILSGLEQATGDQAIYRNAAVAWNKELADSHAHSIDPANRNDSPITNAVASAYLVNSTSTDGDGSGVELTGLGIAVSAIF